MKRNCSFTIFQSLLFSLLSTLISSCETEVDPKLLPVLTTTEVVKMTEATAYSGGNITSDAGSDVISRGVCWSESPNPTIEDNKTIDAAGTGLFESRIVGLNPSKAYFIRAYATNKKGVAYGLQVTFKTKSLSITTTPITLATINSAVSGGTIATDGDSLNVTERGICWSNSANPTITNSKKANGKGKGNYSGSMTELQIATQYYVRAYATNITGTFYGNEVSFITTNGSMTLSTTAATSITAISATIGGNVPNDGGATVTERGFCISKLPNPTITNKIANGSGVGSFASNITGLEANTTYYVRVYATNSVGTAYGNEISFTTKDGIVALSTSEASSITATSATSGGVITNDGGAAISVRGICWSTNPNPTTANGKSTNSGGTGTFATNITNLEANKIYYIRAYATNIVGTYYGNEIKFTTQDGIITLATDPATLITTNSVSLNGKVTSDGGSAIIERGFCINTSPNPTKNNKLVNGTGIGSFQNNITELIPDTKYYIRVYATNSIDTFYGNEISIITRTAVGTIADIDGNIYNYITIGNQTWMMENLKTTKYINGDLIAEVADINTWKSLTTGAFCNYNNNIANSEKYGKLYNWFAVNDTRKIAPLGWHIPTADEWRQLLSYINTKTEGLKSLAAKTDWTESSIVNSVGNDLTLNNSTGFSALPSGTRSNDGSFNNINKSSIWWSATGSSVNNNSFAWFFGFEYTTNSGSYTINDNPRVSGYSIRCIRDLY